MIGWKGTFTITHQPDISWSFGEDTSKREGVNMLMNYLDSNGVSVGLVIENDRLAGALIDGRVVRIATLDLESIIVDLVKQLENEKC